MEKLELKNGEKIEIQDGATENVVQVKGESIDAFKELYNKFTEENLSEISIYNDAEVLCAIYKNKTLSKAEIADVTNEETKEVSKVATFTFKSIDTTQARLKAIEESQTLQGNAIVEMAVLMGGDK